MKGYLIFPFLSSLLYVVGVLLMKRSADFRVGVWRTTFVSNVVAALVFTVLLPRGGEIHWDRMLEPLAVAVLFVGGQAFTYLALETGDVSVATPAMGSKTILVAWLSVLLLRVSVPWQLWVSALLTFAAILLLNHRPRSHAASSEAHGGALRTIALSLVAALCYALFDVLVQKWSPAWGAGRFLPVMFGCCALLSLTFVPWFSAPLRAIPRAAWPWLGGGSLFIAFQALSLVTSLAVYGDATSMNVVYSARGLWSVLAVWWVGHWFGNREHQQGAAVLRLRLLGAVMMTAAIIIALLRH
ncbi:MAG: DMT family transporter [Verrucomicrobiales bacterium]|nr:DMT family transporter [Verrucomicrobiales bacterium]